MGTRECDRVRLAVLLLAIAGFMPGCLEGDPNPLKQGSSSGAINPGTSGGVSGIPTVQPSTVCSKGSTTSTALTFRNQTSDRTLDVFWADYQCMEVRYGTLTPGSSRYQQTYTGHLWRLRDAETGALYKEYTSNSAVPVDVVVP